MFCNSGITAWKLGATTAASRAALGVHHVFSGALPADAIHDSPARIAPVFGRFTGVECEIVFELGEDVPVRAESWSRDDIARAVLAVRPGLEIPATRLAELGLGGGPGVIADNAHAGALVVGAPFVAWREVDLAALAVHFSVDGEVIAQGRGGLIIGGPLAALCDHVESLRQRGMGLTKGQFIATGGLTPYHVLQPGQVACGDFGPLGRVEVTFT